MARRPVNIAIACVGGRVQSVYNDDITIALRQKLGAQQTMIKRASHVEAAPDGSEWTADLGPVQGPFMHGFQSYGEAVAAEVEYLNRHVIKNPNLFPKLS